MARKQATTTEDGFRGFGSQAFPFLVALKQNNDRTWFAENKPTFLEELDGPFRELVADVGKRLEAAKSPMAPNSKTPVFRIYRDVRFSKDKSPYKTNLGAAFVPGGDKTRPGIIYVHLDPDGSFLAAGFYMPENEVLKGLRSALAADPAAFARIVKSAEAKGLAVDDGDPMTRMPKGFEDQAESPVAARIKMRSFVLTRKLDEADFEDRELPAKVATFASDALPFLKFFWDRIDG